MANLTQTLHTTSKTPPLIGAHGQLIHQSSCGCFNLTRASLATFKSEAIVHTTDASMTFNSTSKPPFQTQIPKAAGPQLRPFLQTLRPEGLSVGDAIVSPSFDMQNCSYIIHVRDPRYKDMKRRERSLFLQLLADCYRRCLEEAYTAMVKSVAFPCIGTAYGGWPWWEATLVAVNVVTAWFKNPIRGSERRGVIERVCFVVGKHESDWGVQFELWPVSQRPGILQRKALGVETDTVAPCVKESIEHMNDSQLDPVIPQVKRERRRVGKRELSSLGIELDGTRPEKPGDFGRSSSRARKKPRKYGDFR